MPKLTSLETVQKYGVVVLLSAVALAGWESIAEMIREEPWKKS
jgi:hypothetical protein